MCNESLENITKDTFKAKKPRKSLNNAKENFVHIQRGTNSRDIAV